jgi:hypothetical protein
VIEQVVLAWADPGNVSGRFMQSVMNLMYASEQAFQRGDTPGYTVAGHLRVESGPRIASARNFLVRNFLIDDKFRDVEWLLMLDADMTFDASVLEHLFEGVRTAEGKIARPVVGGLCFAGGHGGIYPTMYRIVDPKTNGGDAISIVTDFEEDEVVEVDATGAACLLIHRGVLEYLAENYEEPCRWFAESVYLGQEFGEDWTFCVRIRQANVPIYVNTAAKTGHVKSVVMDEEMWRTGAVALKPLAPAPAPKLEVVEGGLILPSGPNREQRRAAARVRA